MRFQALRVLSQGACLCAFMTLLGCESSLPTREVPAGNCIQESDCASSGQVCKANQCVACSSNSDCGSLFCDVYGDTGPAGHCTSPMQSVFVDNSDAMQEFCGIADGTVQHPYCSIAGAFDKIPVGTPTMPVYLRLQASPNAYGLPALAPSRGALVFVGPGSFKAGAAATLVADTDDGNIQIGDGTRAVFDGFVMSSPTITIGSGANVTLRRVNVRDLSAGAVISSATVSMDRVLFSSNYAGITLQGSTVNITNAVWTANFIPAGKNLIDVIGGSGALQFATIFKNMAAAVASNVLACQSASAFAIKNSIVAMNSVSQQLGAGCNVVAGSVVVGSTDAAAGQIKQDPTFVDPTVGDLRLKAFDPVNTQYVIDRAVNVSSSDKNIDHDFYGTARPQGAGYDIGAVEFVP